MDADADHDGDGDDDDGGDDGDDDGDDDVDADADHDGDGDDDDGDDEGDDDDADADGDDDGGDHDGDDGGADDDGGGDDDGDDDDGDGGGDHDDDDDDDADDDDEGQTQIFIIRCRYGQAVQDRRSLGEAVWFFLTATKWVVHCARVTRPPKGCVGAFAQSYTIGFFVGLCYPGLFLCLDSLGQLLPDSLGMWPNTCPDFLFH